MSRLATKRTVRAAVRAAVATVGHSDGWKLYLTRRSGRPHWHNSLRPDDYLDDMTHAERRRRNGFTPRQRAALGALIGGLE